MFGRADIKNVFGTDGKCRRNYSLLSARFAGSNPVSAANYGRVAQWIERVKISPLFVAQCATPYGRMPLGLHSFFC
ncbi:sulfur oxidation protein [Neisseria flavescens]|nr:sulfur oxidation protein [Neisseria flavescens]